MSRKRSTGALTLWMNGLRVGTLKRLGGGVLELAYDASWLADEHAHPVSLSLPLSRTPHRGPEVANYFDNLLPDNDDTRTRLRRALGAESNQPFDLLAELGRDCVGALQLLRTEKAPNVRFVDSTPVDEAWIAERLRSSETTPMGISVDEDFRISIGGAQGKTALLRLGEQWHQPHGATPTSHMLKLPIGLVNESIDLSTSVENEWLCMRIATHLGLPTANVEIGDFDGYRALVVERFDRRWSESGTWLMRLPQEDCCQAFGIPPSKKYENEGGPSIERIAQLLHRSAHPVRDRRHFFSAQILYWLLAAIDGHGKNFSLFLYESGRFEMTPLYDIVSAHPVLARKRLHPSKIRMAMAVAGRSRHYQWSSIRRDHWVSTARQAGFSEAQANEIVEETLSKVPAALEAAANELPENFPIEISDSILLGIKKTLSRASIQDEPEPE
ncbi:MAG TPA: type II toxin-antitoxin system HipA family toxin [Planctomycetota bacterium]|nr:type II toxin-antitoxin system HipA family toxin [Planctomycetota bacterium]